ncbi:MAG: hypothetical protein ACTSUE_24020 [Promethearchaeota archaeon]
MNPGDMAGLDLEDLDVILLKDDGVIIGATQVIASNDCEPGCVRIIDDVGEKSSLKEGTRIDVERVAARGGISEIQITVTPEGSQPVEDAVMWVAENALKIPELLKKRPVFIGMVLDWNDDKIGHLTLRINGTKPPIKEGDTIMLIPASTAGLQGSSMMNKK